MRRDPAPTALERASGRHGFDLWFMDLEPGVEARP